MAETFETMESMQELVDVSNQGFKSLYYLGHTLPARAKAGDTLDEIELEGVAHTLLAIGNPMGKATVNGRSILKNLAEGGIS